MFVTETTSLFSVCEGFMSCGPCEFDPAREISHIDSQQEKWKKKKNLKVQHWMSHLVIRITTYSKIWSQKLGNRFESSGVQYSVSDVKGLRKLQATIALAVHSYARCT
jgi:hypothetical protein